MYQKIKREVAPTYGLSNNISSALSDTDLPFANADDVLFAVRQAMQLRHKSENASVRLKPQSFRKTGTAGLIV